MIGNASMKSRPSNLVLSVFPEDSGDQVGSPMLDENLQLDEELGEQKEDVDVGSKTVQMVEMSANSPGLKLGIYSEDGLRINHDSEMSNRILLDNQSQSEKIVVDMKKLDPEMFAQSDSKFTFFWQARRNISQNISNVSTNVIVTKTQELKFQQKIEYIKILLFEINLLQILLFVLLKF